MIAKAVFLFSNSLYNVTHTISFEEERLNRTVQEIVLYFPPTVSGLDQVLVICSY